MPIYTKIGDKGDTITLSGRKVRKDDPQVEAYGAVDELNAAIGVVISFTDDNEIREILIDVQKDLFIVGAELAIGSTKKLTPAKTEKLEKIIDKIEPQLPYLANFVIPGGSKTAALLHLARTISRRVERRVVSAAKVAKVNPEVLKYLNRLSDLLFILARYANRKKRFEEIVWRGK
ncbi:MAG: cob(I)yrinic acid a,c-diamide adenosyltransferase [Candidatus Bilamarchaeaceae archaeon]